MAGLLGDQGQDGQAQLARPEETPRGASLDCDVRSSCIAGYIERYIGVNTSYREFRETAASELGTTSVCPWVAWAIRQKTQLIGR
ncbi:hypothetical protein [Nonomuraea sp. KM90]|uniref:hypothetical protein n=1 Tax=Nonomuraea sp. KM90 TaxID=3457428 RepID=UPI003FCD0E38